MAALQNISDITENIPLRTLVVDDEPSLVHVLSRILENLGHLVVTATAGQDALAIVAAAPQSLDVIFTDVSIPDLSGWELALAARQYNPKLAIVFITGWGGNIDEQMLEDYRINQVINKPYRVRDVVAAIDELMAQGLIGK